MNCDKFDHENVDLSDILGEAKEKETIERAFEEEDYQDSPDGDNSKVNVS